MPEFRQDPIAGYWVAIAERRSGRPIDFVRTAARAVNRRRCPFCPGNEADTPPETLSFPKPDGSSWRLRVVPNLYPALTAAEGGEHEVIIDSDLHTGSFADLPEAAAVDMLTAAQLRFLDWKQRRPDIQYIQFFKNNGAGSGASLEHPHSQLLGLPHCPPQLTTEMEGARRYHEASKSCAYCDMLKTGGSSDRLIFETAHAVAIAPFAPRFAYETWVVPKAHAPHFEESTQVLIEGVAVVLHRTLRALDLLLDCSPLNFLLHTAPLHMSSLTSYHWHIEILPRLSGIGGYEFGTGCYINTVLPETAAAALRAVQLR